jgi:Flp pilus assembly protein CpaB
MARSTIDGHTESARRPAPLISPPAARVGRPRWRDARLLGGVLLVLASVVLGSRVLAAADDTTSVWAVSRDLAAGTSLRADDVERRDVRLGTAASTYLSARGDAPVGYVVSRPLHSGELLPASAVTPGGTAVQQRLVTVPVDRLHRPAGLRRGAQVDVYVTPTKSEAAPATTSLVLASVPVDDVVSDGGRLGPAGDAVGVVLRVPPGQVEALVAATRSGVLDLVQVPVSAP